MAKIRIHEFNDPNLPLDLQIAHHIFTMPDKATTGYEKFKMNHARLKLKVLQGKYQQEKDKKQSFKDINQEQP